MEWISVVFLTFFFSACFYATWNVTGRNADSRLTEVPCSWTIKAVYTWFESMAKNLDTNRTWETTANGARSSVGGPRRLLGGPGSSPPRCNSKCGRCKPCKAVHVPVPPGNPVTAEYYPEAWRCKCGNKLYMP
ncbi:EPIDERMAL PATTERNING FACTOR-like protein 6 [Striga hermonthica]|uniref:Epidermal patterning factor-like protein n=1 Tax=Striga hermonthica TaxID=68872 RepID=A0A9N7NDZ6_STRHE|nr:EPIDERMAL PATTERNING FACTOR-like protein 6 [Striga hermonthica]